VNTYTPHAQHYPFTFFAGIPTIVMPGFSKEWTATAPAAKNVTCMFNLRTFHKGFRPNLQDKLDPLLISLSVVAETEHLGSPVIICFSFPMENRTNNASFLQLSNAMLLWIAASKDTPN